MAHVGPQQHRTKSNTVRSLGAFCTFKMNDCFKVSVCRWIAEVNVSKYRTGVAFAKSI
jgi:hypothetical protein